MNPRDSFLENVSQYDVDFVIPRVGIDIPLGIDPFLLYKSRDPEYRSLHTQLLGAFNAGVAAVRSGHTSRATQLFDFPEVASIGLGYSRATKRGRGVGTHMSGLIIDTLVKSPDLQERGVRHVEEMQLLSSGIGPDRISDIAANLLKRFLISYTQRQCVIWRIPTKSGVPIRHVYDEVSHEWIDSYEDLPVSPVDESAVLFVPRRWVRALPWINYEDFSRTELRTYLAAARRTRRGPNGSQAMFPKEEAVAVARREIALVDRYVRSKEAQADAAQPAVDYLDEDACRQSEALKAKLSALPRGRAHAAEYQYVVLEILNFLFSPELIDGQPEVRTLDGTERRDIVFTNDSDEPYWDYVRNEHSGIVVMFEAKNVEHLDTDAINQMATYLGDRIGRFGVIVTREPPSSAIQRKIVSVWNDSAPLRKVILTLSDDDLFALLDLVCRGGSPTKWMQQHYRGFRTSLQ